MVPPPPSPPPSSAAQYSEHDKWHIRQHLLSLSESYPSLQPKTATFTHNDGRSVKLLQSDGTVPMVYENVAYNIPVVIWLLETYPRHPPFVFVNPTRDMVIKRQHPFVNPSGLVSIPYLQNWLYPSSNLVELARNLSSYFARDPPLFAQRNPNPSFNASGSNSNRPYPPSPYVGRIPSPAPAQRMGSGSCVDPSEVYKLLEQLKEVNIDNAGTLSGVVAQIFDKALMEPTFVEMYADLCARLAVELPDFSEDDEKITFKRLLLNKCQEEFERGEREEEANRTVKQTEEQRVKARRRMLGNIRLMGALYKKKMLTERIMHECIKKLLGSDEEDIEALCELMSTIGVMIDHPKAKKHMDVYFDMMYKLSNDMKLSSRVRFMLKDAIDLRKNKWQQGPKKIEDAAQERQAQSNRLARGPNSNQSLRSHQPIDFSPKGPSVLPSNPQVGGYRGLPQQPRGYGNQDSRFEERHSFENLTLSVSSRPGGDDSITLVPRGGLASRMSIRGQIPSHEMPNPTDSRRMVTSPNGYGSMPDRTGYGSRDDLGSRYASERLGPRPTFDQSNVQEHDVNYVNRDTRNTRRVFDRVPPSSPPTRGGGRVSTPPQLGSDKVLSEDRLHDMSIEAIKEFYSADDEKEVGLCIKDLNAPSFYQTMISIWITDSFERKDMERESLIKLLVNLTRSQDGIISQDSLIKGFESVLSTLEDAVNDAPKAPEFLGRFFARMLLENVIPYKEAWRLIHEGGEEKGQLVEVGLAAEVLGVILEMIKSEKGDVFLKNLREDTNLDVESFRSPSIKRTSRLDKFI